jgi:nitrate reductase gamma subunit
MRVMRNAALLSQGDVMKMYVVVSALVIAILVCIPVLGAGALGLTTLFGVIVPYAAFAFFVAGISYRVIQWAKSPVPFHIPTVSGQQRSLSWIRNNGLESPYTRWDLVKRMALEVLVFRSLLRNDRVEIADKKRLILSANRYLWLGGLIFHWSFLFIILRHLRFFLEPVPGALLILERADALFDVAIPTILISDFAILVSVTYLFVRRLISPQIRFISLVSDYLPLLLILSVAVTGVLMRHFYRTDLFEVKRLAKGLVSFHPTSAQGTGILFYVHFFLVCVLLTYLPLSKLTHMAGIFMSPTRNLINDSRRKRHVNPWNYPVRVHTYEEYEDEFRGAMKEVGLPVEKEEGNSV